jgi:hypothetical protein
MSWWGAKPEAITTFVRDCFVGESTLLAMTFVDNKKATVLGAHRG